MEGTRQKLEVNNCPIRRLGILQKCPYANTYSSLGKMGILQNVLHKLGLSALWEYGQWEVSKTQAYCPFPQNTPDPKGWAPMADTVGCLPSIHSCFFLN